ncbi:MAG: NAD-dependent epimerase/dehydratase family protein [Acidimicrobiales bacterium]
MAETVLVTGGTGFIAQWCIVELLRRGYELRTTVRDARREETLRAAVAGEEDPGDRLGIQVADLTADEGRREVVTGCRFVLHVASPLRRDDPIGGRRPRPRRHAPARADRPGGGRPAVPRHRRVQVDGRDRGRGARAPR